RPLYHAGAAIASNYLVTLFRAASLLFDDAGAPPHALVPLMERTIENGFELTGPIARGDWATVDRHLSAIREREPELAEMYTAPAGEEMYRRGFATWVEPEGAARGLEADHRPGHFRGVATVCLKLFNIVRPDRAYFGRKDAQQVAVLKQLVRDLNLELELRVVE